MIAAARNSLFVAGRYLAYHNVWSVIVIGALSIILGFQLLLQAIVLDVQNEPGRIRRS